MRTNGVDKSLMIEKKTNAGACIHPPNASPRRDSRKNQKMVKRNE
jgi:hypothetical protein